MDIYSLKCWLGHSPEHTVCVIYFMDYSPDSDFITSGAFMNSLLRDFLTMSIRIHFITIRCVLMNSLLRDFSHNERRDIFSLNVELVEKAR